MFLHFWFQNSIFGIVTQSIVLKRNLTFKFNIISNDMNELFPQYQITHKPVGARFARPRKLDVTFITH